MQNKQKVYIIGETTFDIIFKNGQPKQARVGGSQLNTCVSLGRLGIPVDFITKFGNDKVGDIASRFLKENNISDKHVTRYHGNSRVALAFLDEENNADYTFFRPENQQSLNLPVPKENDIILFGSSFAVKDEGRDDFLDYLSKASQNGAIIVYDPNFRKSNIKEKEKLRKKIEQNIALSDIIKGSDEDFINIYGANNVYDAWKMLAEIKQIPLVYTANKEGVQVKTKSFEKKYKVPTIKPVSTIGAGDTFSAGLIYELFRAEIKKDNVNDITEQLWDNIIQTAVRFAQHVCLHYDNYLSLDYIAKQKDHF